MRSPTRTAATGASIVGGNCTSGTRGAPSAGSTPYTTREYDPFDCSKTYCSYSSGASINDCIGYMNRPATARVRLGQGVPRPPPTTSGDLLPARRRIDTLKDYHWSLATRLRGAGLPDEEGEKCGPAMTRPANWRGWGTAPKYQAGAPRRRRSRRRQAARADGGAVRAAHAGADVDAHTLP